MNTLLRDELAQIIAEAGPCQTDGVASKQSEILLNAMRRIIAMDCRPTDSQAIRAYLHSECVLEARQAIREVESVQGVGVPR